MREIKFRAWFDGHMYEVAKLDFWGDPDQATCDMARMSLNEDGNVEEIFEVYLNEVELMQYTGLKDKNGIEIYEGDIVFAIATYDCANTVVVWDDGGFVLVPCKYYKNYISRCGYKDIRFLDKEVVGNIHENPELIQQQEQED